VTACTSVPITTPALDMPLGWREQAREIAAGLAIVNNLLLVIVGQAEGFEFVSRRTSTHQPRTSRSRVRGWCVFGAQLFQAGGRAAAAAASLAATSSIDDSAVLRPACEASIGLTS
jgi:hypothetical protein